MKPVSHSDLDAPGGDPIAPRRESVTDCNHTSATLHDWRYTQKLWMTGWGLGRDVPS
jgi:hypothetical protein